MAATESVESTGPTIRLAHELSSKLRTTDVSVSTDVTFHSIARIEPSILAGLTRCGFRHPSPIQARALPLSLIGVDLIIQSKSGTGKTVVFAVTALQALNTSKEATNHPQVLILAPTREIAQQITDVIKLIGRCVENCHVKTFIGGTDLPEDREALRQCSIAVGTPGRIKQLIAIKSLKPKSIKLLVLDEADKLLAPEFRDDLNVIFNSLPERKQMLAVSATFDKDLSGLIKCYMKCPQFISIASDPSLLGVKQFHILIDAHSKEESKMKSQEVLSLLMAFSFSQCIIFANSITLANSIEKILMENDFNPAYINGKMETKERLKKIELLRNKRTRILISSDLVSRGVDLEFVDLVINVDLPFDVETYYHRVGRAGRFGSHGHAFTVLVKSSDEERRFFTMRAVHSLPSKPFFSFYLKSLGEEERKKSCDDEPPLETAVPEKILVDYDSVEDAFWTFHQSIYEPREKQISCDASEVTSNGGDSEPGCPACAFLSVFSRDILRAKCPSCLPAECEQLIDHSMHNPQPLLSYSPWYPQPVEDPLPKVFFPSPYLTFLQHKEWMDHSLPYFRHLINPPRDT